MKYKVGDKVRVRKDLKLGKMYGCNNFTSSMISLLGRVVTIKNCYTDAYGIEGYIDLLTDDMIEGLAEEAQPKEPEKAINLLREMKHNCEHAIKYDDPKRHDKAKALGFAIELIEHGCSAVEYKPEKPEDISHGNSIRPGYYQYRGGDVFDMAENKWIIDGHHYTCPDCKKTIAIVVNESDEDFEFCSFCGKRMSGQMAENKMAEVAAIFGKKLNERFTVRYDNYLFDCKFAECGFDAYGVYDNPYLDFDAFILQDLLVGRAVIVDD